MLAGKAPTKQQAAALDTYLVTVADHGDGDCAAIASVSYTHLDVYKRQA